MLTLYLPLFPFQTFFYLSCAYLFLLVLVLIFWVLATKTDPSDPRIYRKTISAFDSSIPLNYCRICKSGVLKDSKHCAKCDRCVEEFDHHCEWLNNCVGKRNYRAFFMLTLFMAFASLMKICVGIYLLGLGINDTDNLNIPEKYEEKNPMKYIVFIGISCIKDPVILIFLFYLLYFHIWLKLQGLSTYRYLVQQKNEKNNKMSISTKKTQETTKKSSKSEKKSSRSLRALQNLEASSNNNNNVSNNVNMNMNMNLNEDEINTKKNKPDPRKIQLLNEIIIEEGEINLTKDSVSMDQRLNEMGMKQLDEVRIKKPNDNPEIKIEEFSQRSGEVGMSDEVSINLSGFFFKKIKILAFFR